MSKSHRDEFLRLVKKYLDGKASEEEKNFLELFYAHFTKEPEITNKLTDSELTELESYLKHRISEKIERTESPQKNIRNNRNIQMAAAVLIFLCCSLAYFVINKHKTRAGNFDAKTAKQTLNPGGNKAVLTLANGSKLVLDKVKNGNLTRQPGADVIKTDSLLSYQTTANTTQVSYNTIAIPKGGQYQLVLADGTKVWLNAASTLKFPTSFPGRDRTVELTGEAYFEVARNASKPFTVKTASQKIQVLGTHFNINAYSDEGSVKTTLLEGSVKVASANKNVMIKPGQQSVLNNSGTFEVKNDVDTDEITAWKDGMFQFNDADIQTIMRQVGRWYDVDVEFKGAIPASTYHGKISRSSDASQVLHILEIGGIHFTIEGRKIIVKS